MKIACLQFSPSVGDVDNNLNRADAVLSKANPDILDLLVLPELAFSGYNFKTLADIAPYLEPSGSGITSLWARTTALKYDCAVAVGYPEKVDVSYKWPTGPEYYNACIVVNGDGETVANHRKVCLYDKEKTWALEGSHGFYDGVLAGLGNVAMGIGTDICYPTWKKPGEGMDFAFHILEQQSNLVIVSMAWTTTEDRRHYTRMPNEPDMEVLATWVTMFEPLIRSDNKEEVIVVFCNRAGIEDDIVYAGTSAILGILDGEVRVYGLLGRCEKGLLVADTSNPPIARLVYQQQDDASTSPSSPPPPARKHSDASRSTRSPPHQRKHSGQSEAHSSPGRSASTQRDPRSPSQRKAKGDASASHSSTMRGARPRLVIPDHTSSQQTRSSHGKSRPPEDSTPYPHSGVAPHQLAATPAGRRIFGGHVTVSSLDEQLVTPFDDMSPMEARWHWDVPDSIAGLARSSSNPRPDTSFQPAHASQTPDPVIASRGTSTDFPLRRPSSPKSRNNSRSRTDDAPPGRSRAGSSQGFSNDGASRRPPSRATESRNAFWRELEEDSLIHVAASPSIVDREQFLKRALSRMTYRGTPSSDIVDGRPSQGSQDEKEFDSAPEATVDSGGARADDRGRADRRRSVPIGLSPSLARSQTGSRRRGRRSVDRGASSQRQQQGEDDFERIEVAVCSRCPVHGQPPPSETRPEDTTDQACTATAESTTESTTATTTTTTTTATTTATTATEDDDKGA